MAGQDAADAQRLIRLAVQHAKAAVQQSEKEVYIAGSVGPSPGAIEADSGDTTFGIPNADAREAHQLVIHTLAEAGVDFLCLETIVFCKRSSTRCRCRTSDGNPYCREFDLQMDERAKDRQYHLSDGLGKLPC